MTASPVSWPLASVCSPAGILAESQAPLRYLRNESWQTGMSIGLGVTLRDLRAGPCAEREPRGSEAGSSSRSRTSTATHLSSVHHVELSHRSRERRLQLEARQEELQALEEATHRALHINASRNGMTSLSSTISLGSRASTSGSVASAHTSTSSRKIQQRPLRPWHEDKPQAQRKFQVERHGEHVMALAAPPQPTPPTSRLLAQHYFFRNLTTHDQPGQFTHDVAGLPPRQFALLGETTKRVASSLSAAPMHQFSH